MKETLSDLAPEAVKSILRNVYCSIMDVVDRLRGRSDEFTPPRRLARIYGEDSSKEWFDHLLNLTGLKPSDSVLDVGSGLGRLALRLAKYLDVRSRYEGFDIVSSAIDWCKGKITSRYPNISFQFADLFNEDYNPNGKLKASEYRFPYDDDSFDLVFLASVFTHMLPSDMEHYLWEIQRVLKPNGRCLISFFLLTEESLANISAGRSSLDFKYDLDGYHSISKDVPEKAVSYDESYVRSLYEKCGLTVRKPIHYGSWSGRKEFVSYQDIIIATKE